MESKLLHVEDMILYVENTKKYKEQPKTSGNNKCIKFAGYKINIQNRIVEFYTIVQCEN